jgi:hypothetical protein
MVLRITTTKELYDIIDGLSNSPIQPVMIVLDEHQNYKEFIRIWPPRTLGHHLGATSESWAFEVESEGPNFGKTFRGSVIDGSILRDRIVMYREQLRDHYLAVTTNPTRWDTPPDALPYSTSSFEPTIGLAGYTGEVTPGWMSLVNNDTKKQERPFMQELVNVVKGWKVNKGIIIGGFVLLWIWMLSGMLLN